MDLRSPRLRSERQTSDSSVQEKEEKAEQRDVMSEEILDVDSSSGNLL